MPSPPLLLNEEKTLSRQLTLPVEDRPPRPWNGSSRWFRSANVIDLWRYRTREEQRRMIELAWDRRCNSWDGGPLWPPSSGLPHDARPSSLSAPRR